MRNIVTLFTIILSFICFHSYAQYTTPGNNLSLTLNDLVNNSGGVVTFSNGTYFINNTLTIAATDTLKITTPETIRTAATIRLEVEGTIISNPASGQVLFSAMDTTSAAQNFRGFRFDDSNGNIFRNTAVTHGGGLQLISSEALFEYCTFRRNGSSNVSAAITYSSCSPIIRYCHFIENERSAIGSGANVLGSPHIMYNTFIHNTTDNSNRPQINLGPGSSDTLYIVGNYVEGLHDNAGGIGISNLVGAGSTKAVIRDNFIVNNRYGYAQIGNNISTVIRDNVLKDNNIQNQPAIGGSGLNFQAAGSGNTAIVRRNIITGNLWGITIIDQAQPNFGTGFDQGRNVIYENGNSGQTYALYNNTALSINALGNYWGTNDVAVAEDYIFHQPDDPSLGLVNYQPILQMFPNIDTFSFLAADNPQLTQNVVGNIDPNAYTIEALFPPGTDLTNLIPTIEIPLGATVNPESGSGQNFTQAVIYTVEVPHGEQQQWTVNAGFEQAAYDITFGITDLESGLPIENVSVEVEDIGIQFTDENGITVFTELEPGTYIWIITKEGYYDQMGEIEVIDQDVEVMIALELITSLTEYDTKQAQVFPNPTTNQVMIKYPGITSFSVIDMNGNTIIRPRRIEKELLLEIGNWPKGIYLFNFDHDNSIQVINIIKE